MKLKWAQLDLARQMETVDFIKEFIDLLANAGYNGLLLYLEDRIKTPSYPYPEDGTFYTCEQIKDIIDYAAVRGMEVAPCVATLGHAERFLAHPELADMAELKDGQKGRFGGTAKLTFCPTNPKVYDFLEAYITEVASLFPSQYFHAGLDEFWDYCLCDRCKALTNGRIGERDLFVKHVCKINDIIRKCGKRMMMWSDMFEYYPDALERIPRDIIMVDWQYQRDVRFYLGHLFDCTVENRLEQNRRLGLETVIAPNDMCLSNPRTYLEYAKGQELLGYFLTSWEKSDIYMYRSLPVFVYGGYLLQGQNDEQAFRNMMLQLYGTDDTMLSNGIRLVTALGFKRHFSSISKDHLFVRDFYGLPYTENQMEQSAAQLIAASMDKITTRLGRLSARDLLDSMNEQLISQKLQAAYSEVFDGRSADFAAIKALHDDYAAFLDTMAARWDEIRPGISGNVYVTRRKELTDKLAGYLETLQNSDFLKLRICLPDGYGIQHLEVSIQTEDKTWDTIADSVYKPESINTALAEVFIPFPKGRIPSAVRLSSYGMGGMGICWAEACGRKPSAITAVQGMVMNPEHLLDNDAKFAWFGSQSTRLDYFDQARSSVRHEVVLTLQN